MTTLLIIIFILSGKSPESLTPGPGPGPAPFSGPRPVSPPRSISLSRRVPVPLILRSPRRPRNCSLFAISSLVPRLGLSSSSRLRTAGHSSVSNISLCGWLSLPPAGHSNQILGDGTVISQHNPPAGRSRLLSCSRCKTGSAKTHSAPGSGTSAGISPGPSSN